MCAPARLHLGFLDLHGGLGRRFGSIGLTLEGIATRLRVTPARETQAHGPDAERGLDAARLLAATWCTPPVRIEIQESIPAHVGLGSGTQLRLAVGAGLARLFGIDAEPAEVARLLDRGARSGIGLGAFAHGGLLVDGGRGGDDALPPVISRLPFPESWRVLLLLDERRHGLHGADEVEAFGRLPPFPAKRAAHLCRLTLMRLLPAIALADLEGTGRALGEIQRIVGDHFAPAQGGRFASPAIAKALAWLEAEGIPGIGQSSWGPTGFALVADHETASRLRSGLEAGAARSGDLRVLISKGRNRGAEIVAEALARSSAAE